MALRLIGTLLVLFVIVQSASVDADSTSPLTPQNLTNVPFVFDFTIFSRRSRDSFQYNGTLGKVMDSNRRWELYSLFSQNDATLFYYANSKMATLKSQQTGSPKCVDPQSVLLDDLLADAFFRAKSLGDADVQDELVSTCTGSKWTIRVMNDVYVLCSQGSEWMIFAKLWYGQTSNFQSGATITDSDKSQLVTKVRTCSTGLPVPIVNEEPEAWYAINRRTRQTNSQVAPNNTCIFIHGAGNLVDTTTVTTSETDYWDGITDYTTQCRKSYFISTDTKRRGYYDVSLQKEVCNLLLVGEPDKVVRNKIVFTHSMGLLVVAAALNNGFCNFDNSTALYASQGPAYGSSLSLKLIDICRDNTYRNLAGSVWSDYCLDFPYSKGIPYGSYASLIRNHEMDKLTTLIRSKINGIMCGNTASGLSSTDGLALSILQNFNWTTEVNDGMVPISSCNASLPIGTNLVADFNNKFYFADINHSDGTCRNGDGWYGSPTRNPCSWFGKRLGTGIYTPRPAAV